MRCSILTASVNPAFASFVFSPEKASGPKLLTSKLKRPCKKSLAVTAKPFASITPFQVNSPLLALTINSPASLTCLAFTLAPAKLTEVAESKLILP